MINFIRLADVPQFLVGGAISIGFLLILVPVWIASPGLVSSPVAALVQLGFVVGVSLIAAGSLCRWMKQNARTVSVTPTATEITQVANNPHTPTASDSSVVQASSQNKTIEGLSSAVPESVVTQTPKAVAESLAQLIGHTFSSSRFAEFFEDQTFSDGWTMNDGLAVWYFLGTVSLDVAVFRTFSSQRANLIRNNCDSSLSKQWKMSRQVLERFNNVTQESGESAFYAFTGFKSQKDYEKFFFGCVNRILGANLPFAFEGTTLDMMLKGYEPKTLNPALGAAVGHVFVGALVAVETLLQNTSISWPVPTQAT